MEYLFMRKGPIKRVVINKHNVRWNINHPEEPRGPLTLVLSEDSHAIQD